MTARLYCVTHDGKTRLVSASSPAAAIQHCAVPRYVVTVAKPADVAALYEKGVKVETAKADPAPSNTKGIVT